MKSKVFTLAFSLVLLSGCVDGHRTPLCTKNIQDIPGLEGSFVQNTDGENSATSRYTIKNIGFGQYQVINHEEVEKANAATACIIDGQEFMEIQNIDEEDATDISYMLLEVNATKTALLLHLPHFSEAVLNENHIAFTTDKFSLTKTIENSAGQRQGMIDALRVGRAEAPEGTIEFRRE